MKWLLLTALAGWAIAAQAQITHKPAHYHTIATYITDLNNDGKNDTIKLSSSTTNYGEFNRISVLLAGYKKETFYARDHWEEIDDFFVDSNRNAVNTRLFFLKKTKKQAVILLFGELDGAGYRSEFAIINIENDLAKKVFDAGDKEDIEWPVKLTKLKGDDRLCFIYKDMGEFDGFSSEKQKEKGKPDIGTYVPFYVYPVDDSCKLNKPLTKKYNEDHYIFVDSNYDDNLRIFYPPKGGKFKIWRKKVVH